MNPYIVEISVEPKKTTWVDQARDALMGHRKIVGGVSAVATAAFVALGQYSLLNPWAAGTLSALGAISFVSGVSGLGAIGYATPYPTIKWDNYKLDDITEYKNKTQILLGGKLKVGISDATSSDWEQYKKAVKDLETKVTDYYAGNSETKDLTIESIVPDLNGKINVKFQGESQLREILAKEVDGQDQITKMRDSLTPILKENLGHWIDKNQEAIRLSALKEQEKSRASKSVVPGDFKVATLKAKTVAEIIADLKSWKIVQADGSTSIADLGLFLETQTKVEEPITTATSKDLAECKRFKATFCNNENFAKKANVKKKLKELYDKRTSGSSSPSLLSALNSAKTMQEIKVAFEAVGVMNAAGEFTDGVLQTLFLEYQLGEGVPAAEESAKQAAKVMYKAAEESWTYGNCFVRWYGRTVGAHDPSVVGRTKDLNTFLDKTAAELTAEDLEAQEGVRKSDLFVLNTNGSIFQEQEKNVRSLNFMSYKLYFNRIHNVKNNKDTNLTKAIKETHEKIKNAMRVSDPVLTAAHELKALEALAFAMPQECQETYRSYANQYKFTSSFTDTERKNKINEMVINAERFHSYIQKNVKSNGFGWIWTGTKTANVL